MYINKIEELLNDKDNYIKITHNPAQKIEKDLNKLLKGWLNNDFITKKVYFHLHSSDSLLPKAYGLPKIHKENVPFRIIVSSVNTALYNLAAYLHNILHVNIPQAKSHVDNSFELSSTLSDFKLNSTEILVSLDVVSLFTNVPLDLAIDSINRRWIYIEKHTMISKNEFIRAIKFILDSTFFTFNNTTFKKIHGTPMGSPLSPIIADLVMQDLELTILNSLDISVPLYFRYVDDIIMCIPEKYVTIITDKFNNYHNRLKFTNERENNRCISLLDLTLKIIDNKIHTDWFQKETFSGRLLSFHSNHPICHKKGIIYNLVDRAILLSHLMFQKKNLELIIKMLLNNGYPLNMIFNEINVRIKHLIKNKLNTIGTHSERKNVENNSNTFMAIPYVEGLSEIVASEIKKSNVIVGFRKLKNLNGFIKAQKDRNEHNNNSNVIYKLSCNDCDATYVGQTKRQLRTRVNEHRNNIKLNSDRHSVISEHITKEMHTFNWENTRILDYERNYHKRLISEMLHIKEQKMASI